MREFISMIDGKTGKRIPQKLAPLDQEEIKMFDSRGSRRNSEGRLSDTMALGLTIEKQDPDAEAVCEVMSCE